MAVALRTTSQHIQSGGNRNIYANITVLAGDFLVVYQFKNDNSSATITWDYDSTGTPVTMTKVGEYARATDSEVVLFYHDPAGTVGSVQIHTLTDNGQSQRLLVCYFTGVDTSSPIISNSSLGLYYNGETSALNLTAEASGMYVLGVHNSQSSRYWTEEVDGGFTENVDWTDDGDRNQLFTTVTDDSLQEATWKKNYANSGSSAWGIVLRQLANVIPDAVSAVTTALIGTVDDGNIALGNLNIAKTMSAHIGNIQITKPIEADMVIIT